MGAHGEADELVAKAKAKIHGVVAGAGAVHRARQQAWRRQAEPIDPAVDGASVVRSAARVPQSLVRVAVSRELQPQPPQPRQPLDTELLHHAISHTHEWETREMKTKKASDEAKNGKVELRPRTSLERSMVPRSLRRRGSLECRTLAFITSAPHDALLLFSSLSSSCRCCCFASSIDTRVAAAASSYVWCVRVGALALCVVPQDSRRFD